MESRTTTFEAPIAKDYQQELEEDSGYTYQQVDSPEGTVAVVATPKEGGVPLRFDYSTGNKFTVPEVVVYTAISVMASGGANYITTQDVFSYRNTVRMADVGPWCQQTRDKHARLCGMNRLPEAVGRASAGYIVKLVWETMKKQMQQAHEKKSLAKDKRDKDSEELF
jgi:hypothetical protein